jgi:hypothetical protein
MVLTIQRYDPSHEDIESPIDTSTANIFIGTAIVGLVEELANPPGRNNATAPSHSSERPRFAWQSCSRFEMRPIRVLFK